MTDLHHMIETRKNLDGKKLLESSRTKAAANKARGVIVSILRAFLIFGLAFIILYPLCYMLSVSLRKPEDLYDPTVVWIPKTFTLDNIVFVWKEMDYLNGLMKTLVISLSCSVFQTLTCAITGYGFARFRFKGRNLLFFAVLFTLIVPPQTITMPLYINYVNFTQMTSAFVEGGIQIIDTIIPILVPAIFGTGLRAGLFIYIFRQFFKGMPPEMEEAAYLDGCGPLSAFWRIMLINAGPAILVTFLFSFVWYWNDYLNVSLFFTNARPLSVILANFKEYLLASRLEDGSAFSNAQVGIYVQVGGLMFIAPVLLVYLVLQKYFTQSIVRAGIVG